VRHPDGSAGDADYGRIRAGYTGYRRSDPRISAAILEALGGFRTVLNVGAGSGSYEPRDRELTAVEPSETMRPPELPGSVALGRSRSAAHVTLEHEWCVLGAVASTHIRRTSVRGERSVQGWNRNQHRRK